MHVRRLFPVVSLPVVALVVGVMACGDDDASSPDPDEVYVTTLSGAAERPNPVTSTASGTATVTIENENTVRYSVTVQGIDSAIFGHFHRGSADVSGPIISFLFNRSAAPTGLAFTGTIASGVATRDTTVFSGSFTFDSLLTHIRAGTAYVNVHTRRNTPGEIRGQLTRQP